MPDVVEELVGWKNKLEYHYRDMQDMEFTIEDGKLYMLQTRKGKRTAPAAVKIAMDMVQEGKVIQHDTSLLTHPPASLVPNIATHRAIVGAYRGGV